VSSALSLGSPFTWVLGIALLVAAVLAARSWMRSPLRSTLDRAPLRRIFDGQILFGLNGAYVQIATRAHEVTFTKRNVDEGDWTILVEVRGPDAGASLVG
jgi:hypothetical protein